jgi:DNA-binding NtrC family response regulator
MAAEQNLRLIMQNQYLRSIDPSPFSAPPHFSPDEKLLDSKLANILSIISTLSAAVEELCSINVPLLNEEFDFYNEVERFESNLIKNALRITDGSQVKAAKLLNLKATTLNAKMKTLKLLTK